ncbi:hypothetical protein BUALT_Bualt12G0087500 [Buddleja alternifolia]|uniref:ZF-HD dimerization-type domain-containing protein n=1 Tax=Buddleja alternifolia TaxID=168488 RepID=A0AAV6X0F3_9LAMI|nr:hypothetical protein BUALT_Bualt12G0087500 [Buddleja alternifolia]
MGDKYAECHRQMGGKIDGCQEFKKDRSDPSKCDICYCHRNYHRKVVKYKTEVVYTKCHKIHDFKFQNMVDGCQEFTPSGREGTTTALSCSVCGCHKGFHRNEITVEVA